MITCCPHSFALVLAHALPLYLVLVEGVQVPKVAGGTQATWTLWSLIESKVNGDFAQLVAGGYEGYYTLYICRGFYHETLIPGKLQLLNQVGYTSTSSATCLLGVGNEEIGINGGNFEVLEKNNNDKHKFSWVPGIGTFGKEAIEGGFGLDNEKIYICRTKEITIKNPMWSGKATLIGNANNKTGGCLAAWWTASKVYTDYELFVDSSMA